MNRIKQENVREQCWFAGLDESGDLGRPYMEDGVLGNHSSSRYFTMACILIPGSMYDSLFKEFTAAFPTCANGEREAKWNQMRPSAKSKVVERFARYMQANNSDNEKKVIVSTLTVDKLILTDAYFRSPELLYQQMASELLLGRIADKKEVFLHYDQRPVKKGSLNSFHESLSRDLLFNLNSDTILRSRAEDSKQSFMVQIGDVFAGMARQVAEKGANFNGWSYVSRLMDNRMFRQPDRKIGEIYEPSKISQSQRQPVVAMKQDVVTGETCGL